MFGWLVLGCGDSPSPKTPSEPSPTWPSALSAAEADARVVDHDTLSDGLVTGDVSALGDIDGDGFSDVGVRRTGNCLSGWFGPLEGDQPLATAPLEVCKRDLVSSELGNAVPAPDRDGDGRAGLWIADIEGDAAYLFTDLPSGRSIVEDDADAIVTHGHTSINIDVGVSTGDLDGDGAVDLVWGTDHSELWGDQRGTVAVFLTWPAGQVAMDDADVVVRSRYDTSAGAVVDGSGDFDGDGIADLAVGAPTVNDRGEVWVLLGPLGPGADWDRAIVFTGDALYDSAGRSVAAVADTDGDGTDDLAVGAPFAGEEDEGAAYVIPGAADLQRGRLADVPYQVVGEPYWRVGDTVAGIGDVDGDGLGDLALSAESTDPGLAGAEAAWIWFGPVNGQVFADDAPVRISEHAGLSSSWPYDLVGAGDVNGDGFGDLWVGHQDAALYLGVERPL